MSRRNFCTLVGVLLLLGMPWMSEGVEYTVRGLVATLLTVGLILTGMARIPVKVTIGTLRLALASFAGWFLWWGAENRPTDLFAISIQMVVVAGCFTIAIGPIVSQNFRKWLYGAVLGAAWLLMFVAMGKQIETLNAFIVPILCLLFVTSRFNWWRAKGKSILVVGLENVQKDSDRMVRAFDSPSTLINFSREKIQRWRFQASMFLPSGPVLTQRIYRRIRRACGRYPHTALSWQIAYAAALAIEDYKGAAEIVVDAQSHGFGNVLTDRMLAYAMRAAYDPAWKSILSQAWREESAQPTLWTRDAFYSLRDDPTQAWRESDPVFANLQKRLSVTPKQFEPQVVRASTVSASG